MIGRVGPADNNSAAHLSVANAESAPAPITTVLPNYDRLRTSDGPAGQVCRYRKYDRAMPVRWSDCLATNAVAGDCLVPRFFFHIANDHGITLDDTGHEFDHNDAAIHEARRTAGAILADELGDNTEPVSIKLYLQDEANGHVATVSVSGSLTC